MSFTKWYLPKPSDFAEQIQLYGPVSVAKRNADVILGDPISVDILNEIVDRYNEGLNGGEILKNLTQKFPTYF